MVTSFPYNPAFNYYSRTEERFFRVNLLAVIYIGKLVLFHASGLTTVYALNAIHLD